MQNIEPNKENTTKVVHVCVAVIERYNASTGNKEVFIAKRPKHVHQGGLWEFPGGKVEPGETTLEALNRELFEELDIHINPLTTVDAGVELNHKLIQITHQYPDKCVFLDVWCIQRFLGEPIGKEGQEVRWVEAKSLYQYMFPVANQPILSACLLPNRYFITPAYTSILEAEEGLELALNQAAELIYFRQPQLNRAEYAVWVESLLMKKPTLSEKLMYQFSEILDKYPGAGVHLSQHRSQQLTAKPACNDKWFAVSCHDELEVRQAVAQGADFVTLSPVLRTLTHKDHTPLGWDAFKDIVLTSEIPVFGLGGIAYGEEEKLITLGAQGIAGIRFWQT